MIRRHASLSAVTLAIAAAGAAACLMLGGCQKATEVASQKAAEKLIEASLEKNGAASAKVDLATGHTKVTSVDKDGKPSTFELGNPAAVTEADLGLPFYPGATVDKEHVGKMDDAEHTAIVLPLKTTDTPEKVAAFYREKLKAMSEGRQFVDLSHDGDVTLMLADEKGGTDLSVSVSPPKDGQAEIRITANRRKKTG